MKIAVCVSGAFRGTNLEKNNIRLKEKFPDADFYYLGWAQYEKDMRKILPKEDCFSFVTEPVISYHPYLDVPRDKYVSPYFQQTLDWVKRGGKERIEWTSHHTKQHIAHALLVDKLVDDNYDVIVRTRFDAFIHRSANFSKYIEDTIKHNRANCFAATKQHKFNVLNEFDHRTSPRMYNWLCDQLIIHPSVLINSMLEEVKILIAKKELHAAEYGWYQLLSKPLGGNHRNHDGWVNHDRNVLREFLLEEK